VGLAIDAPLDITCWAKLGPPSFSLN